MPVNYIPTLQPNPMSGSNLGTVVNALKQPQGSGSLPNNNNWNIGGAFTQGFNTAKGLGNALNPSTFGGYNYANMAPGTGLSGSELAQGAEAGVASGLSFDPLSGAVF